MAVSLLPTFPQSLAAARSALAEQAKPLLRLQRDLASAALHHLDLAACRRRVLKGRVAYVAQRQLAGGAALDAAFLRAVDSLERAGLASNDEGRQVPRETATIASLLASWLAGERASGSGAEGVARQAAAIVGNSVLQSASEAVAAGHSWADWPSTSCPCCGGSPDLRLTEAAVDWLVCSRCDARWSSAVQGCLGCRATDEPEVIRIANPELGYVLVVCNACGLYLKERPREGTAALLVERMLTRDLEQAAEDRGLRFRA